MTHRPRLIRRPGVARRRQDRAQDRAQDQRPLREAHRGQGSFECHGYPEDVDIDRYVLGVKVGPRGGFTIPDADVSLRGHYVTSGRVEGSLIAKTAELRLAA
jgi:hypothetical protein